MHSCSKGITFWLTSNLISITQFDVTMSGLLGGGGHTQPVGSLITLGVLESINYLAQWHAGLDILALKNV